MLAWTTFSEGLAESDGQFTLVIKLTWPDASSTNVCAVGMRAKKKLSY